MTGTQPLCRVTRDVTYCVHSRFNSPTLGENLFPDWIRHAEKSTTMNFWEGETCEYRPSSPDGPRVPLEPY